jgi:hypothetical protein
MGNELDNMGEVLDHTLDDYLLGLAQSVAQAQGALNQLAVPAGQGGQAAVAYHLPKLDFELRLHLAMQNAGSGGQQLRFRPTSPGNADSYSGEAYSTIRGSFVSVPLANGGANARLLTAMSLISNREIELAVSVVDSQGAAVAGVEVHVNVDRERSASLNAVLKPQFALNVATNVKQSLLITDSEGKVSTRLLIAASEPIGAKVVVSVDIAGAGETLVVPVLAPVL